jgi:UDP-N-acetylmuramoyl-tripeptide--D-alanyl-D-alanine ligase
VIDMTLAEIAAVMDGRLRGGGSRRVERVVVDSRGVRPGDLFVALPGEHDDGSRYAGDALRAGAAGAVVRTGTVAATADDASIVEVREPGRALMDLARHHRSTFAGRVLAITGSTGKTCTKDFAAAVLRQRFPDVVASPASFNNEIGLPLTLLSAAASTDAVVCEMGSRGPGHIRLLCDIARPEVGVVTNVGVAHMGLFGTPEILRDAKAELPEALPAGGTAILNADDPVVRAYAGRTPARVVMFGSSVDADVSAESIELDPSTGRAAFELRMPNGSAHVVLPVAGAHMVSNALAAAGAGWTLGLTAEECAEGLRTAELSGGRMEVTLTPAGIRVIDDAYNANPASMAAALRTARSMAGPGRSIAVLGHMAELGGMGPQEHERIGELVARLGIDELVVVGENARMIAVGAEREGVEPHRIHTVMRAEEAAEVVRLIAAPGDLVVVKASRVERLERVVAALRAATGAQVRA